jgi:hypothetical protein
MRILFLSLTIGLVTGVISFFTSVALLCFGLLIIGAINHSRPDMTLTFKIALPIAVIASFAGFLLALFRTRAAAPEK